MILMIYYIPGTQYTALRLYFIININKNNNNNHIMDKDIGEFSGTSSAGTGSCARVCVCCIYSVLAEPAGYQKPDLHLKTGQEFRRDGGMRTPQRGRRFHRQTSIPFAQTTEHSFPPIEQALDGWGQPD